MNPSLNYTSVTAAPTPDRWLYLLHGIYGSGRNWGSVARRLVDARPEWGVILVDLRLHGASGGFSGPHTTQASASDVRRLEDSLELAAAVLGHSFGGKVALLAAVDRQRPLKQVWVADSTLRVGDPTGSAWRVVEIVKTLPDHFASRDELADALVSHGYERGVGQWLAMNLQRDGETFRWKLDWAGVEEMLRDYFATDVWPIIEDPPNGSEIHLIKAAESDAIDDATARRIAEAESRTGRVHLHTVEAGHWLNVDNPDALLQLLTTHLP